VFLDLIKGYRVTIGGYNAPLKEHRKNTAVTVCSTGELVVISYWSQYSQDHLPEHPGGPHLIRRVCTAGAEECRTDRQCGA